MGRGTSCRCTNLASLLSSLSWVLDFTDLIPLIFSVTPHESKCDIVFFENLHEAVRLASNLSLNLCLEVRKRAHVKLLSSLSGRLALLLVFGEVSAVFVLACQIPRESPDLLIFSSNNYIAVLIVCH